MQHILRKPGCQESYPASNESLLTVIKSVHSIKANRTREDFFNGLLQIKTRSIIVYCFILKKGGH